MSTAMYQLTHNFHPSYSRRTYHVVSRSLNVLVSSPLILTHYGITFKLGKIETQITHVHHISIVGAHPISLNAVAR